VPDVTEDVTDIVLNLKQVVVRNYGPSGVTLRLEKDGPAEVKAGDIQTTDAIEILNKDLVICSVAKGGRFSAELTIGQGHGYVPAERNKERRCRSARSHRRALLAAAQGQLHGDQRARRPADRLRQAHARGLDQRRSDPADAVAYAAKILKDQLTIFITSKKRARRSRRMTVRKSL